MLAELEKQGGSGFFFRSQVGKNEMQQDLIAHFQSIQHKEYITFMHSCQEFLTVIEQQALNDNWSFDVLEANERSLQQLTDRLFKLQQRDFFPDTQSADAKAIYAHCSQALYEFAISVYTYHDVSVPSEQTSTIENSESQ